VCSSDLAVFYSGYTIPTLNEQDMKRDDVWAGKYTMPVESFDNFMKRTQTEPEVYVLVSGDQQNLFDQMGLYQSFQPVSSYGKMTLYKKMILR
jgi:anti-sigma-K factor RskA